MLTYAQVYHLAAVSQVGSAKGMIVIFRGCEMTKLH